MSAKRLRVRGCADRQALQGRTGSASGAPNWRVNGLASGGAPPLPPAFGWSPSPPTRGRIRQRRRRHPPLRSKSAGEGDRASARGRGFARINPQTPSYMRPKFKTPFGSKLCLRRRLTVRPRADGGSNTSTAARSESGRPHQRRVAFGRPDGAANRRRGGFGSRGRDPGETAAPVEEKGEPRLAEAGGERRRPRRQQDSPARPRGRAARR